MDSAEVTCIRYSDGYVGHARYWPAGATGGLRPEPVEGSPARALLYLHGIQSHGGWFEGSGAALAAAGWHVLMPDRRGSGRNEIDRGHAASAGRLLRDVEECTRWLKGRAGVERVGLVGVSWGGKLALAAAMRRPRDVANLVLVAPGLFPLVDLAARQKLAVAAAALLRPRKRFAIPLNEPELFTDNPARRAFIRDDPLRLTEATARFLAASRVLDWRIARRARRRWPFAATLILAGNERIIDNEATKRFGRRLRCPRMRIVTHTRAAHTLEFEPDPGEYYADLVAAVRHDGGQ